MRILGGIGLLFLTLSVAGQQAPDFKPVAEIFKTSEKIVVNAPFSADAIGESVQFMFDGNKITRTVKTQLFRDSQGRFRRDDLPNPVGIGSFVEIPPRMLIFDPVAGFRFSLDPKAKVAHQFSLKSDKIELKKPGEFRIGRNQQLKQLSGQKDDLQERRQRVKEQGREIEKKQQEAEAELSVSKNQKETFENQIRGFEQRLGEVKAQQERLKKRHNTLESRKDGNKKLPPEVESELQSIDKEDEALSQEEAELEVDHEDFKNKLQNVERKIQGLENQKDRLKTREQENKKQLQQIEQDLVEIEKRRQDLLNQKNEPLADENKDSAVNEDKRETSDNHTVKLSGGTATLESSASSSNSSEPSVIVSVDGVEQNKSTDRKTVNVSTEVPEAPQTKNERKPAVKALKGVDPRPSGSDKVKPVNVSEGNEPRALAGDNVKYELLGTRKIEGLEAQGERSTLTFPAGAIGNDRAFDIVYERWYSKDLQMIIFSKYSDPRFGEQTYRLTNIKRAEPAGEVFKVPADYKLVFSPDVKITPPGKKKTD